MRALGKRMKRFAAVGTTSEGKWAPIICPEPAQCLVCRHVIQKGEPVMCSPGYWVRHEGCIWPGQARGFELVHAKEIPRISIAGINGRGN
jgi:hypothetical protein